MKTLLFYCRHILGIGHLMRSMAIAHGLMQDFQVYFVNGGESIQEFPMPQGINVINLPAVKTGVDMGQPQVGESCLTTGTTLEHRRDLLLELCDRIHPDAVMLESFPFDHHQFAAELIPLLEWAKAHGAKTICSLRDSVVTSQGRAKYEARVCQLINQYFDQLLIHSDPRFIDLEHSFSLVGSLTCDIHYTGYIVPDIDREFPPKKISDPPMILVSVGGGRFGHQLLDCVAKASQYLEDKIPHQIHMFTGPFVPIEVYDNLQKMAVCCSNLTVERYTPDLLSYMAKAHLSISLTSYDTTLNVLQTGVRAMQLPLRGHPDHEQRLRCNRLEELGIVKVIEPADLQPILFSLEILDTLSRDLNRIYFCLRGVQITAARVKALVTQEDFFTPLTRIVKPFS